MSKITNPRDLLVEELKDLYSAENQLIKALPKMVKAAATEELRQAFEEHLEQTHGHVERLEKIFSSIDETPKGKKFKGMEGIIGEGKELLEMDIADIARVVVPRDDHEVLALESVEVRLRLRELLLACGAIEASDPCQKRQ